MQALRVVVILLVAFAANAAVFNGNGSIKVRNTGAFVAIFSVDYDLDGNKKNETSDFILTGVNKHIVIPENATNIHLKVEEYYLPLKKSIIFTKHYENPPHVCFKVWGLAVNPKYAEENC